MFIELPSERIRTDEINGRATRSRSLEFEPLVAELAIRFSDLPAEQGDEAIRDALRRIGETLDLDRCAFYRVQPNGEVTEAARWAARGLASLTPAPARQLFPWTFERAFTGGHLVYFSSVDEIPNAIDRDQYRSCGMRSSMTLPLAAGAQTVAAFGFSTTRQEHRWLPDEIHRLRVIGTAVGNFLVRRDHETTIRTMHAEIERLRHPSQLAKTQQRCDGTERSSLIVGQSAAIQRVLEQAAQVSATDSTVLLLGETGTGKELFASRIHEMSHRGSRPMVRVNCSAIPATLLESELYGREKGAYTGALARQIGRFEMADHSTIFLDEIGDLPQEVQVKLLRVLEERQIERLGSPKPVRVDTRIIAATHRNLEQRISQGAFREDLFYRLNVFPIHVPPLRDRIEDIPLLAWRFVEEFSKAFGKPIDAIPHDNMAMLQSYSWPGNIRELRNVVERAMILANSRVLSLDIPAAATASTRRSVRLVDVEREHIQSVLESTGWRIRGPRGAADRLGLKPTTLETRLAKLGLSRPGR